VGDLVWWMPPLTADRSERRKFEQKVAKETKGDLGLAADDGVWLDATSYGSVWRIPSLGSLIQILRENSFLSDCCWELRTPEELRVAHRMTKSPLR
jgi:hypothetical protein